jgi:hypothetical protein
MSNQLFGNCGAMMLQKVGCFVTQNLNDSVMSHEQESQMMEQWNDFHLH